MLYPSKHFVPYSTQERLERSATKVYTLLSPTRFMAIVYSGMPYSPALPDSPTLSDFNHHPVRVHKAKYTTALESEHSRDLYLQGAMAVGQIARLLEELCAGQYDSDDDDAEDGAAGKLATHPSSDLDGVHQFLSHEKQDQINAWAYAVHPTDDGELVGYEPSQAER